MLRVTAVLLLSAPLAAQPNPLIGEQFADLAPLTWVSEQPESAGKPPVTLVRWWTTNTPDDKASLPALSRLAKSKGDRVRLVAVFHPRSGRRHEDEQLEGYLQSHDVEALLARDPDGRVLRSLAERGKLTENTSVTLLVEPSGRVVWVHAGPRIHPDPEGRHGSAHSDYGELQASLDRVLDANQRALRVMSFNIRYASARDGDNGWKHRRELVVRTIRRFDPDILGTQETQPVQRAWLSERLPEYKSVGRGRRRLGFGEQCTVFVKDKRIAIQDHDTFWLSTTPEVPGSRDWDAALPRIATHVKLKDRRSDTTLHLFNTHFDHRGKESRRHAAAILHQRVMRIPPGEPVIVTGDFNAAEDSAPYDTLVPDGGRLSDTLRVHRPSRARPGTIHGFRGKARDARIDWILAGKRLTVRSAAIDRFSSDGRYPSDHFPVTAVLSIR